MTTVGEKHRSGVRSIVSIAACRWLILGATFAVPASASSLKVNPVHINLPAGRQSVSLKMSNGDAAAASVRVTTFGWTQVDGRDVYTPTNNVIVSPPIFTIPAGQTQLVRMGLRSPNGPGAYRVIFEEIAAQRPAGGQIQVTLKLNLPLYILPSGGGKTDVSWTAWRDSTGELIVEGRNRGTLHSQVTQLQAELPGGPQILSREIGVVLPGSARQWKAGKHPEFAARAPLLLKVRSSAGETQTQIVVGQR
jgi:fimbrial chaperone protein